MLGLHDHIANRDPHVALASLTPLGIQHVLLEGGPTIASSYVAAGVVDDVIWLVAPIVLGAGPVAISVIGHPVGVDVRQIIPMGDDVAIIGALHRAS